MGPCTQWRPWAKPLVGIWGFALRSWQHFFCENMLYILSRFRGFSTRDKMNYSHWLRWLVVLNCSCWWLTELSADIPSIRRQTRQHHHRHHQRTRRQRQPRGTPLGDVMGESPSRDVTSGRRATSTTTRQSSTTLSITWLTPWKKKPESPRTTRNIFSRSAFTSRR